MSIYGKRFQFIYILVVMVMVFGLAFPLRSTPAKAAPQAQAPEPKQRPLEVAPKDDLNKLHPDLRKTVETQTANRFKVGNAPVKPEEPILVQAVLNVGTTLETVKGLFVESKVGLRPFMGIKNTKQGIFTGQILPSKLVKLASRPEVTYVIPIVMEKNGAPDDMPIGDEKPTVAKPGAQDWANLRSQAAELQAKVNIPGKVIKPKDWFEVSSMGPHKAEAAWNRGVKGEGVTVAVNDDGIDYAHPDLMGTQKIIETGPYAGWPMAFSPFSMLAYYLEQTTGDPYISGGYSGTYYADTSTVPTWALCGGPGCRMFDFTPLIDFYTPGYTHTYFFDGSMTKSGQVHVGTHPDKTLRDYVWGEMPAILVTDPNVAGLYDTVYVDLNDNYDFRDDQPLTKAVVGDSATYNNMIAWLDISNPADGIADISGSMVYYVADGVNPIPVSNWLYTDSHGNPLLVPGAGNLVAFSGGNFDEAYSHGTQCASNVVGQGVSNGFMPDWFEDRGSGDPAVLGGAVQGMAPGAKVVNVGDIYWNFESSQLDAHFFSAVGYDGCAQAGFDILWSTPCTDTDAIQVTSNSYGESGTFNDGWDLGGQFMTQIQRYAPSLQFTKSTGNGGPGYGTTAPSSPGTGIYVGASTQFGSTGWDSIQYVDQINFNDVIPFSNRGPSARDGTGVDVLATGAFAAGAVKLNGGSIWGLDGNYAWDTWGGTSRSAPTAAGVLALLYDAFKQGNGRWPTAAESKALMMASATDINYNVFSQGAGSVNADRGSLVGLGEYGFYPNVSSWTPGDYRGNDWGGFAHVTEPGQSYSKQVTLTNPSNFSITADVVKGTPQKIGSKIFTWDLTSTMYSGKSTSNSLKVPQFILPLFSKITSPATQYLPDGIPAGTDLMIIRMVHPYEKFDRNSNYTWDFRSRMIAYNWEDANANGVVWRDTNFNGAVNYSTYIGKPMNIDGINEINWATAEVDKNEYGRYAYSTMTGTHQEIMIQKPVERSKDGIFLGLYVGAQEVAQTYPITFSFEVEFYQYQALPWLATLDAAGTTPITQITIPAHGTASFTAKVNVPADMPVGDYEASIKLIDHGQLPPAPELGNLSIVAYPAHTSVIPITLHVAGVFNGSANLTLGGEAAKTHDANLIYNNGIVRGYFDWAWREESGDWRFFYVDHKNPTAPLLSESFEGAFPPAGWTVTDEDGSGFIWERNDSTVFVNKTGGTGYCAITDSDAAFMAGMNTSLVTPAMDLTTLGAATLTFKSSFVPFSGSDGWVDVTTNAGATWTNVLHINLNETAISRTLDLAAFVGNIIQVRWRYADYGHWEYYWQIDDVQVAPVPFNSADHIVVKDTWSDTATPAYKNDIDTIVLGPLANNTDPYGFLPDPAYFGPYKLDVVGKSSDVRSGRSIWNFNTSSGGPEDWVMVNQTYQDALYEYLQHNVVFHGDSQSVTFEKTIGTINTAPDVLDVTAYTDSGLAGVVNLKSSLAFDGLVADAYGLGGPMTYTNVPITFDGDNLEWSKYFQINHGAKIDIAISSSTISDIDLMLYYCGSGANPGACFQKASSAGSTSDEHVQILKPADGWWAMAVDNYSGPAGTFNYTEKIVQGTNLSVTGTVAAGTTIPAGTQKVLNVSFNKAGMEEGKTYEGLLLFGNAKAASLVEVPVFVTRVKSAAKVEKTVDFSMSFPGENLVYTVDITNQSADMATSMSFEDFIPAGTTYVPGSVTGGATYDAINNKVKWVGVIPPSAIIEGFEGGLVPPTGWTRIQSNVNQTWNIRSDSPHSGAMHASVLWDDPNNLQQTEWLISPVTTYIPGGPVEFWSYGSLYYCRDTYDNCDLNVYLVVDGVGGGNDVLLGTADASWLANWTWAKSTFNLPAILPAGNLSIGFLYDGQDGAEISLDDIVLPTLGGVPHKTFTFAVSIDTGALGGNVITNTASLVAKHDLPTGLQTEPVKTATATTVIGWPANFNTSFKEATAVARPKQVITTTIHVVNSGDAAATITLRDLIPAGTTYKDHVSDIPYQNFNFIAGPPNTMEWVGTVAPHAEWVFTYRVTVNATQPRGTNIVNTATIEWADGLKRVTATTNVPADYYFPIIGK